jgi:hypothetical protein
MDKLEERHTGTEALIETKTSTDPDKEKNP